jgi:hypothetical protein
MKNRYDNDEDYRIKCGIMSFFANERKPSPLRYISIHVSGWVGREVIRETENGRFDVTEADKLVQPIIDNWVKAGVLKQVSPGVYDIA